MPRPKKPTWDEIIPVDQVAFTKSCLNAMVDHIQSHAELFSTDDDRKLFRDWLYFDWIGYYEQLPSVLSQIGSVISGVDITPKNNDRPQAGRDFIDHMQHAVNEAKKIGPDSDKAQKLSELISPRLLPMKLGYLVLANHFACFLTYNTTISGLIAEIKEGSEEAIFDLISVDHIFLELPLVRNHIREATLFNDEGFLAQLGRAVELPAIRIELSEYRDEMLIVLAWHLGFDSIGLEQFGMFLREIGITKYNDTSSLRRKLNRLGLYTRKIRKDPKA